ncbi:MAG: outer membrane protein assembly factor BamD [Deltaproteobacteria bacterium]|nr:outer membrane protein assembly factor BamD [Deltaproteobacteria bacterium]
MTWPVPVFGGLRPWFTPLICAPLLLLTASACDFEPAKSTASLTYTEDAFKAYREAMVAYDNKDWEDARALLKEVKRLFAYSRYARLAELRLADIDFEQGKYSDAIGNYRSFVKGYRGDTNVEYAKYRISKALFLDISDTMLLPPAEERDQANARDAHRELKAFVRRFPRSRHRVDARYMLEVVTQRLVRHEIYVARYYLRRDNFDAAVMRVDYALDNFPGSGLDAEALVLKGETLLKMKKPSEARVVFETVIRDYGGPFGHVAKRFLDQMTGAGKTSAPAGEAKEAEEAG